MNRKAEAGQLGAIIIVAIALIVGVIFFQVIAQETGKGVNTVTLTNSTATASVNGSSFYLTDYRSLTATSITNGTTGATIPSSNYTITNNVVYNGNLAVKIALSNDCAYGGETWAINGVAQPLTYIADSGARSVASLIAIFFALAIVVVALSPTARDGLMNAFS